MTPVDVSGIFVKVSAADMTCADSKDKMPNRLCTVHSSVPSVSPQLDQAFPFILFLHGVAKN